MKKSDFIEREVALLDEFEYTDENGNVLFDIDEPFLNAVSDNSNRRIKETGDECPVVIGHVKDGAREEEQPAIVAWARNFTVKPLFATGRKAIFATFRIAKDKVSEVAKYPRRSVELWLKKQLIDPIALLGATTPERDLGVLRFAKGESSILTLSPNEEPMNDDVVTQVIEAIKQLPQFQFIDQLMKEQGGEGGGAEGGDGGQLPPVEDEGEGDPGMSQDGAGAPPPAAGQPPPPDDKQQFSASGSNTTVPGMADLSKVQMQLSRTKVKLDKYAGAYTAAFNQNAELRLQLNRAVREKDLVRLEAEGFYLDIEKELNDVASLDQTHYDKHLERIRDHYRVSPVVGLPFGQPARLQAKSGTSKPMTKDDTDRIVDFALANKLSYGEAKAKLSNGGETVL